MKTHPIKSILLAKTVPEGVRRLLFVISAIFCLAWVIFYNDEVENVLHLNFSELLTFVFGFVVSAFFPISLAGLYVYLPVLGKNRKWEKAILFVSLISFMGLFFYGSSLQAERSGISLFDAMLKIIGQEGATPFVVYLIFTIGVLFFAKLIRWIWLGLKGEK